LFIIKFFRESKGIKEILVAAGELVTLSHLFTKQTALSKILRNRSGRKRTVSDFDRKVQPGTLTWVSQFKDVGLWKVQLPTSIYLSDSTVFNRRNSEV
jgi:hypothetical protein